MKKLVSLFAILLLASCSSSQNASTLPIIPQGNEPGNVDINPTQPYEFSYTEPEEEAIVVTKDGVEVSSIEIIDIPKDGIKIACWNEYDIKIKVRYSDNSIETLAFYEKYIPIEFRHYLGEIGHHSISVAINTSVVHFGFDIIENKDFTPYSCTFWDYRGSEPKLLQSSTVGYYQNAVYTEDVPKSERIDDDTNRVFVGWDYSLNCVHQDMIYKAQFRDVSKRFYGDNLMDNNQMLIASNKKDDKNRALIYVGRLHAVPVNYGETIHHNRGATEADLSFKALNPFNDRVTNMGKEIVKYGISYSYNANYGSYLYGTTGAFGEGATILNSIESFYGASSKSRLLETGVLIDTSIDATFSTCYSVASSHISDTRQIESTAETGYYRIALTMSFDVYISATFSKVNEGRYTLENGAKYVFAPVRQTNRVKVEFSETTEFDNPFKKTLIFSTDSLYNVANGLDW